MIIGWDGTPFLRREDGVGRYSSQLLRALAEIAPQHQHLIIGFSDDPAATHLVPKSKQVKYHYLKAPRRVAGNVFKLLGGPAVNRQLPKLPDVMVHSNFVRFPRVTGVPSIVVVHDLVHVDMPETVTWRNRVLYLGRFVGQSVRRADAVVTLSKFVAGRLTERYKLRQPPVIIPPAVDERFARKFSAEELAKVRKRYHLPKDFILFLGSLQPRKNLVALVNAYHDLPDELRQRYPLVLGGAIGWKNDELQEIIGGDILTPGFIGDDDLPALYAAATVFIFPSLYEGFGIPPLEAMAAGTPVIATDATAVPEVVGKAAVLVDPRSLTAMTAAMRQLLSDAELRQRYIKLGREQAAKFTWEASARKLLELIGKVTGE